ncbi:hypothetical protein JCM9279_000799 [Rhodotorula babjevae]
MSSAADHAPAAAPNPTSALSTGPATPTSPAVAALAPNSTTSSTKALVAQHDTPMEVDSVDSEPRAPPPPAPSEDELILRSSRPLDRVVGPFTPAQGTPSSPATNGDKHAAAGDASTSRDKRPLEADSPPPLDSTRPALAGEDKPDSAGPPKKKARKSVATKPADTLYCHQDHQAHDVTKVTLLRCTAQKVAPAKPKPGSTEAPTRPCSLTYCARCLASRYDIDAEAVVASGADASWTCPSCRGECNCSSCRKRTGLDAPGPLKELGIDPERAVGPVTGGRRAAAAARTKLSSGYTASGKVAAMALTNGDGSSRSPAAAPSAKKGKGKKVVQPKATTSALDGSLSDSSLSELTDSDEEQPARKPAAAAKGKGKATSGSPAPVGPTGKRAMPPRAPPVLPLPPRSHILASVWAPSPTLPCDESIRARLHLREWFLRFLPCLPPLDPTASTSSSSKSSSSRANSKAHVLSPHLVRVLSALSDDVLWLWRDRDSAAEAVQLRLLQALCEVLVREKAYTGVVHKLQREDLDDLRVELRTALAGVQRHRDVFDRPWRTAQKVAEGGLGSYWVDEGPKWHKDALERRKRAEGLRKGDGAAGSDGEEEEGEGGEVKSEGDGDGSAAGGADGSESELSSLASSDDDDEVGAPTSRKARGTDDEVDQLASDYEEPPPKLDKAGRRMKGERDMPGEERLAVLCALIELASSTEAVRAEMTKGVDYQYTEMIALRKKRVQQRKELPVEKARLEESKPEKPPGNSISTKVKEWQDACDDVEAKIEQLADDAVKNSLQLQSDFFLTMAKTRIRFTSLGRDAHGTEYYTPAPPPDELLESSAGSATSGFPLDRKDSDDGVRDYPLSWCIIGHGRRPATAAAAAVKREDDSAAPGDDQDWFVVRGLDDLDALAEWVDLSARHAEYQLRLAQFQLEHPKTKTNGVVGAPPTPAQVAAYEAAAARADDGLPDALRQFADAVKWRAELARREKEGEGAGVMAERTRAHKA